MPLPFKIFAGFLLRDENDRKYKEKILFNRISMCVWVPLNLGKIIRMNMNKNKKTTASTRVKTGQQRFSSHLSTCHSYTGQLGEPDAQESDGGREIDFIAEQSPNAL
jgi:hypothetical protein